MTDLIETVGPFLGIAAFLGLAVLAFLIFQQAREVRRLREWAGRAPERAGEAGEASLTAAEARGEEAPEPERDRARVATWWDGVRERMAPGFAELDRRLPVAPRYLFALLAAALVAALVLTSGFGILDGDSGGGASDGGGGKGKPDKPDKIEVAVLNATQVENAAGGQTAGVQGLAGKVADEVVKPAGFKAGEEETAASGFEETTIMFEPDSETDAKELAKNVADQLGETPVTPMIQEVRDLAGGAPLALVIGQDDAEL